MATATPDWTDNVSVIAATTLAAGNKTQGTIYLRSKFGEFLFVRLGRKGSSAPGSAIQVQGVLNNDGAGGIHPGASVPLAGSITTGQAIGAWTWTASRRKKRHGDQDQLGES